MIEEEENIDNIAPVEDLDEDQVVSSQPGMRSDACVKCPRIDHKEWSDDNGPNNALRVNGFGAPRAFFTPIARQILFPDVSYGEDYAMCLRISREYAVGRIYDPLYFCRRWEGNSDAALSVEQVNAHNTYKDFIRSVELIARMRSNRIKRETEQ